VVCGSVTVCCRGYQITLAANWEFQRRLIGNEKPAIWENGGPAHHRIGAAIASFYRYSLKHGWVVDAGAICAYYAHTRWAMKSDYDPTARKRPVNLTLNENLVDQAKGLTDNLSQVVETLLDGYVAKARDEQLAKRKAVESTVKLWNDFNAQSGSFSDEYSSL
jgi:antitoxin CcdA